MNADHRAALASPAKAVAMHALILCLCTVLAPPALGVAFDVRLIYDSPQVTGNPVLALKPDGLPCVAYYSEAAKGVVFADYVDGAFNFSLVDSVLGWTEVALAIGPAGAPSLAYGDGVVRLAHRVGTEWVLESLDQVVQNPVLDLEFAPDGTLGVIAASGALLRYWRLGPTLTSKARTLPAVPSNPDLEFDAASRAHITYLIPNDDSPNDLTWGTIRYLKEQGADWFEADETVTVWVQRPALELLDGEPVVTATRNGQGQTLLQRAVTPLGFVVWQETAIQLNIYVAPTQYSAALSIGPAGVVQVMARGRFWQAKRGTLDAATVEFADIVGREGMATDGAGQVHAIFGRYSGLHYATLRLFQLPKPQIVGFAAPDSVHEYGRATLEWDIEHAGGSVLEPPGMVFRGDGRHEVLLREPTEFRLTAIGLGGESTAVRRIEIIPTPPVIVTWEATPSEIVATEEVTFTYRCERAASLRIDPLGIETTDVEGFATRRIDATADFVLTALNSSGVARDTVTVRVTRPLEIRSFTASDGLFGTADEVELRWEVFGHASVSIDGLGPQPAIGSTRVVPGQTRDYVLRAQWEDYVETAVVHVVVDPSFSESQFLLSYAPDAWQPAAPALTPFHLFPVYVLGRSLDGERIAGMEFGLDHPPGLMLLAADLHSPSALNIVDPPDFIVGLGQCYELSDLHLLATLTFMAGDQTTIDQGEVGLRPAVIQSIPGRVAYATCWLDLNGSEVSGPMIQTMHGPPLYLSARPVPAYRLGLQAERSGQLVRLRWNLPPAEALDRLQLARSDNGSSWQSVATWSGTAAQRSAWEGPAAASLSYYRLRGFAADAILTEEIVRLAEASIPTRTRLLGAHPNPFNPRTTIHWEAAAAGSYQLSLLNTAGRLLRRIPIVVAAPGAYAQEWDGRDAAGRPAASGVYFVQLDGMGSLDRLRVVLVK